MNNQLKGKNFIMGTYTKGVVRRLVLFLVLYALIATILFAILLGIESLFRISLSVDHATLAVILCAEIVPMLSVWVLCEILTYGEKSDNTEDKGPADEKPADAATETTDGTAGNGAEDETDDKA